MPERSYRTQGTQVGLEVTAGTAVAANKRFQSIDFNLGGRGETVQFKPQGNKFNTVVAPAREWSEFDITGNPVYDELQYVFAGLIGAPVITTVNTTGKQYVFTPNPTNDDTVSTFTIEKGSSVRAHKAAYCMIQGATLTVNRGGVTLGGNGFGQRITDAITLTTSPTTFPQIPILATEFDLYIDATRGALGTTKLTRGFSAVWNYTGRFQQIWPINSTLTSFGAHIEGDPAATLDLTMAADSVGMSYLTNFRAGSTVYARLKSTSAQIIGAGPAVYSLQMDFALKFNALNPFSDQDGLYAIGWPCTIVDDGTWPMQVTLVNAQAAL
jgi:hypothetical protein